MKDWTTKDIVNNLIGNINPVGETNEDNKRFDNLKAMCELVESLVQDIKDVEVRNRGYSQYSIRRASQYASTFLSNIGINPLTESR